MTTEDCLDEHLYPYCKDCDFCLKGKHANTVFRCKRVWLDPVTALPVYPEPPTCASARQEFCGMSAIGFKGASF